MKNRTGIDFSKHIVEVKESDGLLVHHIKIPGTSIDNIKFINTNGIMAVTGDYGNWIFCREFHPSIKAGVSDGYWHEKLKIASTQEAEEFDSVATRKRLEEGISGGLAEWGYRGEELEKAIEYYNECLNYVDYSEFEYSAFAYQNMPGFFDSESVPFCKEYKFWLKAVFDGFEEICDRLKSQEV